MKKTSLFTLVAVVITLITWTSFEATKVSSKTYYLNQDTSKLVWTGRYVSDGHTHVGTIKISKGELQINENNSISGNFTIDMTSIINEDLPEGKNAYLIKHLNSEDFFNSNKFKETIVKVSGMTNNEINATIIVMGKEINAKLPISLNKTDNSLEAKGKFEIDFSSLDMPGTKASKGKPENERTDSKIAFDLTLSMKG